MNCIRIVLADMALMALVGCALPQQGVTTGSGSLEEIPEYPDLPFACDTSARVCVYSSLRFSGQLFDALKEVGFEPLTESSFSVRNPVPPDFIVDELTYNNWTQSYGGNLWLFTRISVWVRAPYRLSVGSDKPDFGGVRPRVFQAYARKNLGRRKTASLSDYVANEGVAARNLMKVKEFREALTKAK